MNQAESKFMQLIHSGHLQVDDCGKIWKTRRFASRFTGYKQLDKPVRAECENIGYLMLNLREGKTLYRVYAHRIVWIYFNGDIPSGMEINHINGKRNDNHLCNLEVVTPSGNVQHAYRTGLAHGRKGEKHHNAHLTEADVKQIRAMGKDGEHSQSALGKLFGVGQTQIGRIIRGLRWKHIH